MSFLFPIPRAEAAPLVQQVTRQAWSMLMMFREMNDEIIDPLNPTGALAFEEFGVTEEKRVEQSLSLEGYSTEEIGVDDTHAFYLDMFPRGDADMHGMIGFVALHMEEQDDEGETVKYSELVFRQESHPSGPAVFKGNETGLEQVKDDMELLVILDGLISLTSIGWAQYVQNPWSIIQTHPQSDVADAINRISSGAQESDE